MAADSQLTAHTTAIRLVDSGSDAGEGGLQLSSMDGGSAIVGAASDVPAVKLSAAADGRTRATLQQFCEEHFGLEWLRRWGATAQQVCSAVQQLRVDSMGKSGGWSRVTCRSMNDSHMPAASAPHVLCDATNLRLDPSKLVRCPADVASMLRSKWFAWSAAWTG
jgi:protein O-GlcNAc transferase